jgi:hypothetical protein
MHFCRISACAFSAVVVDVVGGKDADDDDDDLRALFGDLEGDLGRSAGLPMGRGARGIVFAVAAGIFFSGADICAKSRKKAPEAL